MIPVDMGLGAPEATAENAADGATPSVKGAQMPHLDVKKQRKSSFRTRAEPS
jgi:hypothetical protein